MLLLSRIIGELLKENGAITLDRYIYNSKLPWSDLLEAEKRGLPLIPMIYDVPSDEVPTIKKSIQMQGISAV